MSSAPDVLVLGAGGTLGDAWMSALLMGIEDAGGFDARDSGNFLGTSAGSIVASYLAAGVPMAERLRRLPDRDEEGGGEGMGALPEPEPGPSAAARGLGRLLSPLAGVTLSSAAPGGRLLRRLALSRVPHGEQSLGNLGGSIASLGLEWGGRLRIAVVGLRTGERVMLDGTDPPGLDVSTAVLASCAIPAVFPPVDIGGELYVDGGVWSFTNLDAVEAGPGERVLCLNPSGSAHATGHRRRDLLRGFARNRARLEAAALRRRGAEVTVLTPDRASTEAMGTSSMDHTRRAAVTRAGYAQGQAEAASRAISSSATS